MPHRMALKRDTTKILRNWSRVTRSEWPPASDISSSPIPPADTEKVRKRSGCISVSASFMSGQDRPHISASSTMRK